MPCNIKQYCRVTWYPSNYNVLYLEPVCLNSELLGTLHKKRHDAVVVIFYYTVYIMVTVLMGCIFTRVIRYYIYCIETTLSTDNIKYCVYYGMS